MSYVVDPPLLPALAVVGGGLYPVRRIFCVGRNYAAHAAEMGAEIDREAPWYFTKSAHALCPSGAAISVPSGTQDCQYEIEFVVALGGASDPDGVGLSPEAAGDMVYGYASGIDLTRRDLQAAAKATRRPWDIGKDFDKAAIIAPITPAGRFGPVRDQAIWLDHNGAPAQQGKLSDMVWTVGEIIAHLAGLYCLRQGDLIMTGTPAGVGPVGKGSRLRGGIDGLAPVCVTFRDD
ncbi:MAG: fumarylacetoacetate hydrolase family protein [Pseudomonadota bacterium]